MHGGEHLASSSTTDPAAGPWHRDMTRYHWFVLLVAALGWLFDCLDQQLFTLATGITLPSRTLQTGTVDATGTVNAVSWTTWRVAGWATAIQTGRVQDALFATVAGLLVLAWLAWAR